MKTFDEDLAARLIDLREQGLYRELRRVDSPQSTRIQINGQSLLNFSSNDYLGLAGDPVLKAAAAAAVEKYGAGSGASRLICGSLAPHHDLEEALAAFKGAPAALSFSSGYAAAVGTICALLDSNDVISWTSWSTPASWMRRGSRGAKLRVFGHNDLNDVETDPAVGRQPPHRRGGNRPALRAPSSLPKVFFRWTATRRRCGNCSS